MRDKNIDKKDEEVEKIIRSIDLNGNQMINYSEFLTATLEVKNLVTDEKLWMMFRTFDTEDKNFITTEDIAKTMSKMGKNITEDEVNASMRMHNL